MKPGVSGVGIKLRGNGLSDAIKDTRLHGRVDFQIRSGKGEVRVSGTRADIRTRKSDRPDQTTGTWAWLTHQVLT